MFFGTPCRSIILSERFTLDVGTRKLDFVASNQNKKLSFET